MSRKFWCLVLACGTVAAYAATSDMARGAMMGGGGMMGGGDMESMRSMMQRMMGDSLPPAIDRSVLPEPQSEGASVLVEVCSQCHNFPGPGMHTAQEWPAVVERMNRRERMMAGMMGAKEPSREQVEVLTRYLQAHAQRPIDEAKYGDLRTSAGGKAFADTCAQCHALPDPEQHTAGDWPSVVARMLGHEHEMHKNVPDDKAVEQIIGFLEHHGR